jgi:Tol biopolymer transport system component
MFRLSPDGSRVVASLDRPGSTDLLLFEVERGVPRRFTRNSSLNIHPIWSPNGQTILFSSGAPGNLFRRELSGAGSEQTFSRSPNSQFATDWSRDGLWVLYYEVTPGSQRDLWVVPVTSDGKSAPNSMPRLYLRTPYDERLGRFSPEAHPHWVAYQSDETNGRREVYLQAFPEPREAMRISTGGGQYPQWGAGGRELFYVSLDNKLMVVSLKLGPDTVEPSSPRELFPLPAVDDGFSPYDIAPDGRFLVRATQGQAARPLTVIVNWPALLKKEATAP